MERPAQRFRMNLKVLLISHLRELWRIKLSKRFSLLMLETVFLLYPQNDFFKQIIKRKQIVIVLFKDPTFIFRRCSTRPAVSFGCSLLHDCIIGISAFLVSYLFSVHREHVSFQSYVWHSVYRKTLTGLCVYVCLCV